MTCSICGERKARRACPGVNSEICSICCGNEREVSISCPLECEYLQESRRHEKRPELDPKTFPNSDIRVSEQFLLEHEDLLILTGSALLTASLSVPGAIDSDAREALDGLIRTFRTLQSGIYYESRPENPIARSIFDGAQQQIAAARQKQTEEGKPAVRDPEVLTMLVFLERIQLSNNNGRPKSRAFLDFLRQRLPGIELPKSSGGMLIAT